MSGILVNLQHNHRESFDDTLKIVLIKASNLFDIFSNLKGIHKALSATPSFSKRLCF